MVLGTGLSSIGEPLIQQSAPNEAAVWWELPTFIFLLEHEKAQETFDFLSLVCTMLSSHRKKKNYNT